MTSYTFPPMTSQQSSSVLCFCTSSISYSFVAAVLSAIAAAMPRLQTCVFECPPAPLDQALLERTRPHSRTNTTDSPKKERKREHAIEEEEDERETTPTSPLDREKTRREWRSERVVGAGRHTKVVDAAFLGTLHAQDRLDRWQSKWKHAQERRIVLGGDRGPSAAQATYRSCLHGLDGCMSATCEAIIPMARGESTRLPNSVTLPLHCYPIKMQSPPCYCSTANGRIQRDKGREMQTQVKSYTCHSPCMQKESLTHD